MIDSLPPIKRPNGLLPLPDSISERLQEQLAARIHRYKRKYDTWLLTDACDIAFGLIPMWIVRQVHPRAVDSDILRASAKSAVRASNLAVGNRNDPEHTWWVIPREFARWIVSRPGLVGNDRARIFELSFAAEPSVPTLPSKRRMVLESEYSTPEFEAALGAIAEFWLSDKRNDTSKTNHKVIKEWLQTSYQLSGNAVERIDTLIRPENGKGGGRRATPQNNLQK